MPIKMNPKMPIKMNLSRRRPKKALPTTEAEEKKRLHRAGIRYKVDFRKERRFEYQSRLKGYKICLEPKPPETKEEIEFENLLKSQNDIFVDLTKSGDYTKQHWHIHMCPIVVDDDEDEEGYEDVEVCEDEEDYVAEKQMLALRFDKRFWDDEMVYYGEKSDVVPNTLQIYSLKLITEGDYSLDVYGELWMHCSVGFGPQIIFSRDRGHCQTITKQDPYLLLTGPYGHPLAPPSVRVVIESMLRVKGTTQSEDKYLRLFAKCDEEKSPGHHFNLPVPETDIDPVDPDHEKHVADCCKKNGKPCMCEISEKIGKPCLLEMRRSIVTGSIVANIYVEPVGGYFAGGYFFTAYMGESPSDDMKVVLLDCRDGKLPRRHGDGTFVLSRQTICVDRKVGTLKVYIEYDKKGKELIFSHCDDRLEHEEIQEVNFGFSLKVRVQWSVYLEKYEELFVPRYY